MSAETVELARDVNGHSDVLSIRNAATDLQLKHTPRKSLTSSTNVKIVFSDSSDDEKLSSHSYSPPPLAAMVMADEEDDNDAPIPFIDIDLDALMMNSSSSEFLADAKEMTPHNIYKRRHMKRPMPRRNLQKRVDFDTETIGNIKTSASTPKFRPTPPNMPKVPIANCPRMSVALDKLPNQATDEETIIYGGKKDKLFDEKDQSRQLQKISCDNNNSSSCSNSSAEYNSSNSYSDSNAESAVMQINDNKEKNEGNNNGFIKSDERKRESSSRGRKKKSKNKQMTEANSLTCVNKSGDSINDKDNKDVQLSQTRRRVEIIIPTPRPEDAQSRSMNNQTLGPILRGKEFTEHKNRPKSKIHSLTSQLIMNSTEPVKYVIERKVLSRIGKNKVSLTLTTKNGNSPLIYQIFDYREESVQFMTTQTYSILFTDGMTTFSLRRGAKFGDELLSIHYKLSKNPIKHKVCVVHFFVKIPGLPITMQNESPYINAKGRVVLSFGRRKVVPSVKNMIFRDAKKRELMAIMKKSKTTITIDAAPVIPEEMIFLIGVSAFLNNSK